MSDSLISSDGLIQVAWVSAQVSMIGTALLLLCVFWVHWHRAALASRQRALVTRWRPLLAALALDSSQRDFSHLPPLAKRDRDLFLREWIAHQEALDQASCGGLDALGQHLQLGPVALRMLRQKRLYGRLLGTTALGYLGDESAWQPLFAQVASTNIPLSIAAARALIRLDANRAVDALMPYIEQREDWPATRISVLLQEAGPAAVTGPLIGAIRQAPPGRQSRLTAFLDTADEPESAALIHDLLVADSSDEVVAGCLSVIESPAELPQIRKLTTHPRWHIRMLAAKALGRLGEPCDEALLVSLLADPQWWVRYRAAQALVALPWVDATRAQTIQAALTDRYAGDAMAQAIAEQAYR